MSDLHKFPDSLARILMAANKQVAHLRDSEHNELGVARSTPPGPLRDKCEANARGMRLLAETLADDIDRWSAMLEAAELFARAITHPSPKGAET